METQYHNNFQIFLSTSAEKKVLYYIKVLRENQGTKYPLCNDVASIQSVNLAYLEILSVS